MNRKPYLRLELITLGLGALCLFLGAELAILEPRLLLPVPIFLGVAIVLLVLEARSLSGVLARQLSGRVFQEGETQYTLAKLPTPAVLLGGRTILWYNAAFKELVLGGKDCVLAPADKILPGLQLAESEKPTGQDLTCGSLRFTAWSSTVEGKEPLSLVILAEDSQPKYYVAEYAASRPVYIIYAVDGYEEQLADLRDSERARLLEAINRVLEEEIGKTTGFLRRVGTGRFVAVVEKRHLEAMCQNRFDVLDKVRAIDDNLNLTLSVGVGVGEDLAACQVLARQSLDMALGRGGDQAAMKTADGFEFYGGVSRSVEKRSRVKSRIMANALCDLVRQSDSVIIMGHRMGDLDSLGSALGVLRICKICRTPAVIALRRDATLAGSLLERFYKAGLGEDFTTPEDAATAVTSRTLLVVVDTYQSVILESAELYAKCRQVVVIDHHRKAVGHIENPVLLFHEPYASSASEMVCELLEYVQTKEEKLTQMEAEALLAGIMLDTRGFSLHCGVRTFEAAAFLRRMGAETEPVKRLFNTSMAEYAAKAALVEKAQLYKGCAVSASGPLEPGMAVAIPQAANELLTIDGVDASFVAVETPRAVNVSARSMGAVNVQVILEALGGGGHLTMAGAQVKDATAAEVQERLFRAIDEYRSEQHKKEE